jgi:hypothetical protein
VKTKFRLYARANGVYYCEDVATGRQESLHTKNRTEAEILFHAGQEAHRQPSLNLQIARTYLSACDPAIATRTWQDVMDEIVKGQTGSSRRRWEYAIRDKAFSLIRDRPVLQTHAEDLLKVMRAGKVATNVYLRRIHNFARRV